MESIPCKDENLVVRISDVAKLAGVSTATVSRTINDSGYVSQDTRIRVLEAMDELGYTPPGGRRTFLQTSLSESTIIGSGTLSDVNARGLLNHRASFIEPVH